MLSLDLSETNELDYAKVISERTIKLTDQIVKPATCISIIEGQDKIRMCTYENMSVIMGEQKSRKSYFVDLMAASALKGVVENMYGENESRLTVIFDTEQADYDFKRRIVRISKMFGKNEQPDNLVCINICTFSATEQVGLINWYLENNPNVGLLIIDGILDLVDDFNDVTQSKEVYIKTRQWRDKYKLHICGVMHTGTTTERNALGHIGRILQRKAESVIILEIPKADKWMTQVSCRFMRGQHFKPFAFRIEDDTPKIDNEFINENVPF